MKPDLKFIIAISAALIITMLLSVGVTAWWMAGDELPTRTITGLFIDINGDGLIDYVKSAEVIVNRPLSLPTPTP